MKNLWYVFSQFVGEVISAFRANQGFLLAGAVAYYTLLSIVPMFALVLVVLSQLMEPAQLLETTNYYLELLALEESTQIIVQLEVFLANWKVVGAVGVLILLFFSSLAFTSLENAMSVIFHHRVTIRRRHFLISAIIPYLYLGLLALGLLIVSSISASLHANEEQMVKVLSYSISLGGINTMVIYTLGIVGELLLLTSLYLVMPVGRLSFSHALIGGITATVLWELTRHFLVWYFSTLSLVNVVYGSFASAIVILLSCEAAALILLIGAQVIAVYEQGQHSSDEFKT
ncbi:YihY/virulence factor BrkB family protein [Kaarinaea lacus]